MKINPDVFEAYLKCPIKCWLRATDEPSGGAPYSESSERLKRIARKVTKNSRAIIRANTIVDWPGPMACPECGGLKIHKLRLRVRR